MRGLVRRFGVGRDSIRRHRDTHLRQALAKSVEEARLDVTAESLTRDAHALHAKTLVLLGRAEEEGDLANARGLIREARENLLVLGRIAGVIDVPVVHVDARRQVAVLSRLSEEELRALAAGDEVVDADVVEELPA
jgi:hypothetical protein